MPLETWELMSYVVTVIGLPLAILVFLFEQRKERENEEEEVYQLLSDNYQEFLKVALDNPDLRLFSAGSATAHAKPSNCKSPASMCSCPRAPGIRRAPTYRRTCCS